MTITENKILNGIKCLVKNTNNVGRTKLFKLLYFWDFMHFKKYGMSVTCYEYRTYPFGPVPDVLFRQINRDDLPPFLRGEIAIISDESIDEDDEFKRFKVCLKNRRVDLTSMTPNERGVLEWVADVFKYATAKQMTEITHLHNSPWEKTYREHGFGHPIDYFLAIDDETTLDREEIEEFFTLQKELHLNGRA
ncbi:MAG: Panacea domain-containing protein [bacterium]